MLLFKKFVNETVRGLGYALGYYVMKNLVMKANDPVKRADWKRNIKRIKGKFRVRKVERA